jgi:hypothetical protein
MLKHRRIVSWQGWHIEIPRRWDPVKLEGDHAQGHALFADTVRPRLGLRWQTPRKSGGDPSDAVESALKAEVGLLASKEARPVPLEPQLWQSPLLYVEPQPPGRDVFCGFSTVSGRLLQLAYHAHRRESLFASGILPTLEDLSLERAALWSIFDLNCVIPGGMHLKNQRLNAGDLGLTFSDRLEEVTVRQIAVAQLALQRLPLDGWITDHQKPARRYHTPTGVFADTTLSIGDRDLPARISRMHRRLRYALLWNVPPVCTTIAAHDAERDRLMLLHGSDESLLREIARTAGAASVA